MPIERELKYNLGSSENRDALLALLPRERKAERQENYFFDDAERNLLCSLMALRVRLCSGTGIAPRAEITLKGETRQTGALAERPEDSVLVEKDMADDIIAGKIELAQLDIAPVKAARERTAGALIPLVSFSNERIVTPIKIDNVSVDFEFDTTKFQTKEPEYELEIEFPDIDLLQRAAGVAEKLAAEAGFELRPQLKSKFQRALEFAGLEFNF